MNDNTKAKIVERCLSALHSGEWTKEDCLRRYPELARELQDYFALSEKMQGDRSFDLTATELRLSKAKILNHLPDRTVPVTKMPNPRYQLQNTKRRLTMTWVMIVTMLLSIVTGTGVVLASGDALPGEALYPVKTATEEFQLMLAPDTSDARLHLRYSEYRVEEIKELIEKGRYGNLDEAVDGYQEQIQAMTHLMAEIQAENPDSAVRLRSEIENGLQAQESTMEALLDESTVGDRDRDRVQDQLQTVLHTNLQTRLHIHDSEDVIPSEPADGADTGEVIEEATNEANGNGAQVQNREFVNASGNGQNAAFTFRIANAEQLGVYAEAAGKRYACTADGDLVTCNIPNAAADGVLNLYCTADNDLLYSYSYDYDWLGTKEPEGSGGSQSQGDSSGSSNPDSGGGSSSSGSGYGTGSGSGSGNGSGSGKGK